MMVSRHARGFTLIEILVALAILAIALSALMDSTRTVTHNAAAIQERMIASWVAEDLFNEYRIKNQWPAVGKTTGQRELAGHQWRWNVTVEKTGEHNIYKITVDVTRPDAPDRSLSTLATFYSKYDRSLQVFSAS